MSRADPIRGKDNGENATAARHRNWERRATTAWPFSEIAGDTEGDGVCSSREVWHLCDQHLRAICANYLLTKGNGRSRRVLSEHGHWRPEERHQHQEERHTEIANAAAHSIGPRN